MGNTYGQAFYHVVFSTKNRYPWMESEEVQARVWAYMAEVARSNGATKVVVGGVEDHVHLLFDLPTTLALAAMVKQIKGNSSVWFKETFKENKGFSWQDGYGYFPILDSMIEPVTNYIRHQKEHHRTLSFVDEYKQLLREHGIAYDEKYL